MADIKAADVAKLRKTTGAGMMDCKKALAETNGDFEAAIDYLRKKGQKVASKRADRDASEGAAIGKVSADQKTAVLAVLNCETDFVAKNEDFVKFATSLVDLALAKGITSKEDLLAAEYATGVTVAEEIATQTGVIGEKLDVTAFDVVTGESAAAYIHPGNQVAAVVAFNQVVDSAVGKDVAMQIAAMGPVAIDKDDVPADIVARELEVGKELAIQEGKPEAMAGKIAEGRLNKFFKESTLLNQDFIKENKQSVKQYLQASSKDLTVTGFKRASLSA